MEFLKAFFSQGWFGSLIGIIGLVISFLLYRASRIGPQLVYQLRALRLIGKKEQALPQEVEILFRGRSVSRLTMTHVVLWNAGKVTLDGENIIADDPLRLEFSMDSQVLRARVLKVTRESNKFMVMIKQDALNEMICSFDYLDPGDGVVIELLHTDDKRYPNILGTIRGVPKGILNWGRIPSSMISRRRTFSFPFKGKKIEFVMIFIGIFLVTSGICFPKIFGSLLFVEGVRLGLVMFGLIYASLPLLFLWSFRRRFPKSLMIEDIEE